MRPACNPSAFLTSQLSTINMSKQTFSFNELNSNEQVEDGDTDDESDTGTITPTGGRGTHEDGPDKASKTHLMGQSKDQVGSEFRSGTVSTTFCQAFEKAMSTSITNALTPEYLDVPASCHKEILDAVRESQMSIAELSEAVGLTSAYSISIFGRPGFQEDDDEEKGKYRMVIGTEYYEKQDSRPLHLLAVEIVITVPGLTSKQVSLEFKSLQDEGSAEDEDIENLAERLSISEGDLRGLEGDLGGLLENLSIE